jgi:hypothetical protein
MANKMNRSAVGPATETDTLAFTKTYPLEKAAEA